MTRDEKIENIKKAVHSELDISEYNSTGIRNSTNCYSHAIGSTLPYLELYRIGAISGKKEIDHEYNSIEEIKQLLFSDFKVLNLQIEESSEEDELLENQHRIALFVAISNNGKIYEYHFLRLNNGEWTEKRKNLPCTEFYNNSITKYKSFPWHLVGYYKITK